MYCFVYCIRDNVKFKCDQDQVDHHSWISSFDDSSYPFRSVAWTYELVFELWISLTTKYIPTILHRSFVIFSDFLHQLERQKSKMVVFRFVLTRNLVLVFPALQFFNVYLRFCEKYFPSITDSSRLLLSCWSWLTRHFLSPEIFRSRPYRYFVHMFLFTTNTVLIRISNLSLFLFCVQVNLLFFYTNEINVNDVNLMTILSFDDCMHCM